MAKTVKEAFKIFFQDHVRLDKARSDTAKASKNYLVSEVEKFPRDGMFLQLHPDVSIDFGSFSRKNKIRPLDDIDIMVILHAEGNWRTVYWDRIEIGVPETAHRQLKLCHDGTRNLNSIKVVNKFKEYLSSLPSYENAIIKRNQEAVTLKLKSYEWFFDIVPCFVTSPLQDGKTFFLIPDGKGNWKATDPRLDKQRVIDTNSLQTVFIPDIIRIMKYWTSRPTMPTMKSYFLECLILNYYTNGRTSSQYVDEEVPSLLAYVYHNVLSGLNDPKGFQGDINHLTSQERASVQEKARTDYHKAKEAGELEIAGRMKQSIQKWGEIFGEKFPSYTGE